MDTKEKQETSTKRILCGREGCFKRYWPDEKEDCRSCQYNQTVAIEAIIAGLDDFLGAGL